MPAYRGYGEEAMKAKNKTIFQYDLETTKRLQQEYIDLGFDTSMDSGVLTVYALKEKKVKDNAP